MNPVDDAAQYLKIDDAARLLGVSRRWVYRRIWSGELAASKIGGLYFIQRSVLEDLLSQRSTAPAFQKEEALSQEKCGYCYRLLTSDEQIGEVCQAPGCEKIICSQCLAEGIHHCAAHTPSRDQKLEEMQQRQQRGEIQLLVKGSAARLLEINFINRLQARLEQISNLIHPLSSELLSIQDWSEHSQRGDQRSQVMRLLNKVMLDSGTLARTPLNAFLTYTLPPQKRQKGTGVQIHIQVISRLAEMARQGFDTLPLSAEDLQPWLVQYSDEAQQSGAFHFLVLASPSGWDASARQLVQGKAAGSAFMHRLLLVYLYDLAQGELVYNTHDERTRAYAELFTPLQPEEQIEEAGRAIENELVQHKSLALDYAAQILPFSPTLLRQAFDRLAAGGQYTLLQLPEYGLVIARK